jgi:uncharacterized hydantoinase/oxoprolinase family protein
VSQGASGVTRTVIGWDIGGAHVKAALLRDGRLEAVSQWPCALWQGLHLLDAVIDDALADGPRRINRWCRQPDTTKRPSLLHQRSDQACCTHWRGSEEATYPHHAVTMTGEMVDLFDSRKEGVTRLVRHLEQRLGPHLHLFCSSGEWVGSTDAAYRWQELASANWAATARLVCSRLMAPMSTASDDPYHPGEQVMIEDALLVDIGSTTTDFIPLAKGRVLAVGAGDAERLRSGELLYQGAVRTPLCALAGRIEFRGRQYNLMNEWFATTADVYRLTGELDPAHDQHPAADGGSKDVEGCSRRLARMIGHDAQDASLDDWRGFAREWRRRQLSLLQSELERVEMQHWLRQDEGLPRGAPRRAGGPMALVGAGCGSFLVRALALATQRPLPGVRFPRRRAAWLEKLGQRLRPSGGSSHASRAGSDGTFMRVVKLGGSLNRDPLLRDWLQLLSPTEAAVW